MVLDFLTSPPASAAASPSMALLAAIPSLSPTYPSSRMAKPQELAPASTYTVPDTDSAEQPISSAFPGQTIIPAPQIPTKLEITIPTGTPRRESTFTPCDAFPPLHRSSLTGATAPHKTITLSQLAQLHLGRSSCPEPILASSLKAVISQRQSSLKIALPPVPTHENLEIPPVLPPKGRSERLSFSCETDENAARKASYRLTPYPVSPDSKEAKNYMQAIRVMMGRTHPCDRNYEEGEGGVQWRDPWAEVSDAGDDEGILQELLGHLSVNENLCGTKDTGVIDQSTTLTRGQSEQETNEEKWSSVGMESACSVDSACAVEGDSLLQI